MTDGPMFSVIIPCYRDWTAAADCLRALSQQTVPRAMFEVILVNNDPNDPPPPDFPAGLADARPACKEPGSYAARNTGLAVAQGRYLCFTDSDCLPAPDWLARLGVAFAAGADRVGGRICLFHRNARPNWVECYEIATAFRQDRYVASGWAATANMAARRDVFDRIGPFDATLKSSGDKQWGQRAAKAGVPVTYRPDAVVNHPSRSRFAEVARKARRVEGGRIALRLRKGSRAGFAALFLLTLPYRLLPVAPRLFTLLGTPNMPLGQRLKAAVVFQVLRWVQMWERGRILLGGSPTRA